VNTWFVGTVNRLQGEPRFSFIWTMQEFATEAAARRYAKDALNKGLRVEAGTLPEIQPEVRIRWRDAADWVASEHAGPPPERGDAGASLALIDFDEFDLARRLLPDLTPFRDYDDWRDFREGKLLGLSIAGVDARFVPIKLAAFLEWRKKRRLRADLMSLDAYAEAIRNGPAQTADCGESLDRGFG
jgi:hypothetical protein